MRFPIRHAAALAALSAGLAAAGPGAHGPNGEHLDAPAPVLSAGSSVPRAEAKSELFELVARTEGGALSIFIDRYETNEPVLGAQLDVESGSAKARAAFRPGQGDYAVTDPELLKVLSSPGSHPLLFAVTAGNDTDLLDASMQVAKAEAGHDRMSYAWMATWVVGAGLLPIGAIAAIIRARRAKAGKR